MMVRITNAYYNNNDFFINQLSPSNKLSKVNKLKNSSIISLTELKRIKKNISSLNELSEPISPRASKIHNLKSEILMKRIKSYGELTTKKIPKIHYNTENILQDEKIKEKAKKYFEENIDEVKKMNKLVLYAKIASIRDKQIEQQKTIKLKTKKFEEKMDLIYELERLKNIKKEKINEEKRKNLIKEGGRIIKEQIKYNLLKKLKEKEEINKENMENLKMQQKLNEEEEKKIYDAKKIKQKLILYIIESNKQFIENKKIEKSKEIEEEKKLIEYNEQKAKEEEINLLNKKNLQKVKELELAKIREKQKKSNDFKLLLDELRMKRSIETTEKNERIKEKNEIIKNKKKMDELINFNKLMVDIKAQQKIDNAIKERNELFKNLKEIEKEIKRDKNKTLEKERKLKEHNYMLIKMIKEKEDKEKLKKREILEEGRIIKQNNEKYYKNIEKIKKKKIKELELLNINPEYLVPLKNYKTLNK